MQRQRFLSTCLAFVFGVVVAAVAAERGWLNTSYESRPAN